MKTPLQEYLEKHPHSNKNQFMIRIGLYTASKELMNNTQFNTALRKDLQNAGLDPSILEIKEIRKEIINSLYSDSEYKFT